MTEYDLAVALYEVFIDFCAFAGCVGIWTHIFISNRKKTENEK